MIVEHRSPAGDWCSKLQRRDEQIRISYFITRALPMGAMV
jgi:hypothetical protein